MEFKSRLKVWQGSNRKNEFNPETFEAHSYKHWCYVRKIKGVVVFNDYNYSVTTNKHQGEMKSFLRDTLKINLNKVVFADQGESLTSGLFLDSHYEKMSLAEIRAKNSNRLSFIKDQNDIIQRCKKDIAILKSLGAKSCMALDAHRANAKQSEASRLEGQRTKSAAARAARNAVVTEFKSQYESTASVEV